MLGNTLGLKIVLKISHLPIEICFSAYCSGIFQPWALSSDHGLYNLEKVLNFSSRLEKSLNSVKVLEKYLISLLGLEKSLKFHNLFIPYHISEKLNDFAG